MTKKKNDKKITKKIMTKNSKKKCQKNDNKEKKKGEEIKKEWVKGEEEPTQKKVYDIVVHDDGILELLHHNSLDYLKYRNG